MQLMTSVYCLYLFSALQAATGLERTQYPAFMSLTSKVDVCQMIVPEPGWGGPRDDPDPYASQPPPGPQKAHLGMLFFQNLESKPHCTSACLALGYIPPSNIQLEKTAIWASQHQGAENILGPRRWGVKEGNLHLLSKHHLVTRELPGSGFHLAPTSY